MTAIEKDELLFRGPRTFKEGLLIRDGFMEAIGRAMCATDTAEQCRWLAESDRYRRWLHTWPHFFREEVRRMELSPSAAPLFYIPEWLVKP